MAPSLAGGHEKSVQLPMLPARTALKIGISRAQGEFNNPASRGDAVRNGEEILR
jgi:hypothetical protein